MIKKIGYILIVATVVAVLLSPFFIQVRIECESQFGECPSEIILALQSQKPKNLFEAHQKAVSFLKKSFLISEFSIQFKLPNIMQINIIAKKPYFALKTVSGKFGLIDLKGVIISVSDNSSLPVVSTSEELGRVGGEIKNRDLLALNLISGVYQMYQVGYGAIENDALVVDMPTGVRVIFPLDGSVKTDALLGGLRLIYTKVTTDYAGIYSQIDMRYKNPVLSK